MSVHYKVHFKDGSVIEKRGAACFANLRDLPQLVAWEGTGPYDPTNNPVTCIENIFQSEHLVGSFIFHYVKYLFEKFNKYILDESVENIVVRGSVKVSAEAPAKILIGILSFFRYINERKSTVIGFNYQRSYLGDSLALLTHQMLEGFSNIGKTDIRMYGTRPTYEHDPFVFERMTFKNVKDFIDDKWDVEGTPFYLDSDYRGIQDHWCPQTTGEVLFTCLPAKDITIEAYKMHPYFEKVRREYEKYLSSLEQPIRKAVSEARLERGSSTSGLEAATLSTGSLGFHRWG